MEHLFPQHHQPQHDLTLEQPGVFYFYPTTMRFAIIATLSIFPSALSFVAPLSFLSNRQLALKESRWTEKFQETIATEATGGAETSRLLYPENKVWAWDKPSPKSSLQSLDHDTAPSWLLNLVEAGHWMNLLPCFFVLFTLYSNSQFLGANSFFFELSVIIYHFSFVGAILVHSYEGWQVAPFRNPLASTGVQQGDDDADTPPDIEHTNNAWLRIVFLDLLATFINLSYSFFAMGVYGINAPTIAVLTASLAIGLLGPKQPMMKVQRRTGVDGTARPIAPLAVSQAIMMAVTILVATIGTFHYFYPVFEHLGVAPALCCCYTPMILQGFGGAYEGVITESSFKQWQHLLAAIITATGTLLLGCSFGAVASFHQNLPVL